MDSRWSTPMSTDAVFDALPPVPYHSHHRIAPRPPRPRRLLDDGDVVDLGDRVFEVIHTPGHSPGGIALFERSDRHPVLGRHRL